MGMSASQARYLALTARMNDVEYQGQQINQQRTTLATQINELYNSLLDMSVPTPPSQSDYKRTVYSGTLGATDFTIGAVRPQGSENYSVDLSYTMAGDAMSKKTTTKSLIKNTPTLTYIDATADAKSKIYITRQVDKYAVESRSVSDVENLDNNTPVAVLTTKTEADQLVGQVEFLNANKEKISSLEGLDESDKVYILTTADKIKTNGEYYRYYTNNNAFKYSVSQATENILRAGYTENDADRDSRVKNLGLYYYTKGEDTRVQEPVLITTFDALLEAIENGTVIQQGNGAGAVEFKNPTYSTSNSCEYLVKNGDTYTPLYILSSEDAKAALIDNGIDLERVINGIRHSFNISEKDMLDNTLLSSFSVFFIKSESGKYTANFIRNSDTSNIVDNNYTNIPTYEYNASGTYTQAKLKEDCKLEFDSNGRITKIGIPNNGDYDWVDLSVSSETDEDAYNEAMKEYNYKKIQYDETQEKINLKTSIVQQQDKNLELKLTRLDNERTALHTELEAVKKVITDNIDKTYKTFNG